MLRELVTGALRYLVGLPFFTILHIYTHTYTYGQYMPHILGTLSVEALFSEPSHLSANI